MAPPDLTGAPLVLGFSGGGDSLALLHRLMDFGRKNQKNVHALIVNHKMKPSADAEAKRAYDFAGAAGAKAEILCWSGAPLHGHGRARTARYQLLARATHQLGAKYLFLAHTLDDQIETFFLRLAAGSSWRGLAAMAENAPYPVWPDGAGLRVLRPLLQTIRADLRTELRQKQLDWIEDPANSDHRYARVRMRKKLAKLQEHGFDVRRVQCARLGLQQIGDVVQQNVRVALEQYVKFDPLGFAQITPEAANALPHMALSLLLEHVMLAVSGRQRCKHTGTKLVQVWDKLWCQKTVRTLNGCLLQPVDGVLLVMRDPGGVCGRGAKAPSTVQLDHPGTAIWFDQRWQICTDMAGLIAPLGAYQGKISPQQQAHLQRVPHLARAALPILQTPDRGMIILPIEASNAIFFAGGNRGMETGTNLAYHEQSISK